MIEAGLLLVEATEDADPSPWTMVSWLHPMSVGVDAMRQRTHSLTTSPATLIVPVKETKGYLFINGLFRPFGHCIRIFSIAHDLFDGHKWSTRMERDGAASGWNILRIR